MSVLTLYLAEIGRRGGMKSRRMLDPETARRMVRIREARRAAKRLHQTAPRRAGGTPADTSEKTQTIQNALWQRLSPAEKLDQVARLSRMVDRLSLEGLRQRHPEDGREMIRHRRASMRLGLALAARVYDLRRDDT